MIFELNALPFLHRNNIQFTETNFVWLILCCITRSSLLTNKLSYRESLNLKLDIIKIKNWMTSGVEEGTIYGEYQTLDESPSLLNNFKSLK